MSLSHFAARGKSPGPETVRTPRRGDPCRECGSLDTFVYADPADGPELMCGRCLSEEVGLDLGDDVDLPTERELDHMFATRYGITDPFRGNPVAGTGTPPFPPYSLLRHFRRT